MKLIDICEAQPPHPLDPEFEDRYQRRAFGEERDDFHTVVNDILKKYPEYAHNGPMFRIVGLRLKEFAFKNQAQVLDYINQQVIQRQQKMQSWSSTLKGVLKYHKFASVSAGDPTHVSVILEQTGVGFDVKKYATEKGQKKWTEDGVSNKINHFGSSKVVDELLAAPQNPTVFGYMIGKDRLSFNEVLDYLKQH